MNDVLDSRALRLTDCYAQRFMRPGTYRYAILPAGGDWLSAERPFTIRVADRKDSKTMKQHSVRVTAGRGGYRPDPGELSIEAGDLVLWNCPDGRALPYTIVGDKEFFDSSRLVNESGYSHAFGSAGEYRWADAHGSGASGVVRVRDPQARGKADFARWQQSLAKGTLVTITDGQAAPQEVEILTGQTVFFAVVKGPGVSITDERLLPAQPKQAAPRKSLRG